MCIRKLFSTLRICESVAFARAAGVQFIMLVTILPWSDGRILKIMTMELMMAVSSDADLYE